MASPAIDIDLEDKYVQKAAAMIQKSFRGHRVRNVHSEDGPPKFLTDLQDATLVEGSDCRLECRLGQFPETIVTWYKDCQEIKEGVKYSIIFDEPDICALCVLNGCSEDVGKYTCKAFNSFGEVFQSAMLSAESRTK